MLVWVGLEVPQGQEPCIVKVSKNRDTVRDYIRNFAVDVRDNIRLENKNVNAAKLEVVTLGHLRLTSLYGVTDWYIQFTGILDDE